jgi:hypothetical protein
MKIGRFFASPIFAALALLALPVTGFAQEASISGTITDATGGVLPGVSIIAVHEQTGNTFETVTDGLGQYRVLARIGSYSVSAFLGGFADTSVGGVVVNVNQDATVDLQMATAGLEETVTVTGEAPLLDTTSSTLGSNIDQGQMEELPINGRNWQDLAMLAVGNKVNEVGTREIAAEGTGNYQVNVDGQQVTYLGGGLGNVQPRFSRDAIAEFEYVSNRFDASQGRSTGVQINAVTKSGSNQFLGSFGGYFRHDALNAPDSIAKNSDGSARTLPFGNEQFSMTHGGPLITNRLHYFANFEYEHQKWSTVFTTPFPAFNLTFTEPRKEMKAGARVDYEITPSTRFAVTGNFWENDQALDQGFEGSSTRHPSYAVATLRRSMQTQGTLTKVIGNRAVNTLKVGWLHMGNHENSHVQWGPPAGIQGAAGVGQGHPGCFTSGICLGAPIVRLRGLSLGPPGSTEQNIRQGNFSLRNDFVTSYEAAGRHDLKIGADYINSHFELLICRECTGIYDLRSGRPPSNLEEIFPVWNDPDTWQMDQLLANTRRYTLGIGTMDFNTTRHQVAGWVQDDWQLSNRFTLNLGLRYDITLNGYGENYDFDPWVKKGRPMDSDDIAPRVGFAYQLDDRTVIRGGAGKYYGWVTNQSAHGTVSWVNIIGVTLTPDGRSDFLSNPFNGPQPTFDEVKASTCWDQFREQGIGAQPGCIRRYVGNNLSSPENFDSFSYQGSIGFQRQIGDNMAFEADYVYWRRYHRQLSPELNIAWDNETGEPYGANDVAHLPFPEWGEVDMRQNTLGADGYNHTIQAGFTKRFSDNWQASATYSMTLDYRLDWQPVPPQISDESTYLWELYPQMRNCTHPISWNDAGTEWNCHTPINFDALGEGLLFAEEWYQTNHQIHRFVFNAIYNLPGDVLISGLYFYGDNGFHTTESGVNVFDTDNDDIAERVREDRSVIPRRNFDKKDLHRLDLRLSKRFNFGRVTVEPLMDMFNVLNRHNFTDWVIDEQNANFRQPEAADGIAYQPRVIQLGFKMTF